MLAFFVGKLETRNQEPPESPVLGPANAGCSLPGLQCQAGYPGRWCRLASRQAAAGKATQYYVLATWLVLFRPELFNTGSLPSLGPSLIKLGLPKDCSISEIKAYLNSSK